MTLTPELVEYAKKEIGIEQYLQPAETVTAQHILYKDFIEKTKWKSVPKLIVYIILNETYGMPTLKDSNGDLGYQLRVVAVKEANNHE